MQRKLCFLALALLLAALSAAADNTEILGRWSCKFYTPDGEIIPADLEFKEVDGTLQGVIMQGADSMPLRNPKFENGSLTFQVEYQGEVYEITAKPTAGKLDGEWRGAPGSGRMTGEKK